MARKSRCVSVRSLRVINRREALETEALPHWRPRTRGDCEGVPRPCPYVSCRHNLYFDVTSSGSLCINYPHVEVTDMTDSCVLDIVDNEGPVTLERVGEVLNITRERVRQVELQAVARIRGRRPIMEGSED